MIIIIINYREIVFSWLVTCFFRDSRVFVFGVEKDITFLTIKHSRLSINTRGLVKRHINTTEFKVQVLVLLFASFNYLLCNSSLIFYIELAGSFQAWLAFSTTSSRPISSTLVQSLRPQTSPAKRFFTSSKTPAKTRSIILEVPKHWFTIKLLKLSTLWCIRKGKFRPRTMMNARIDRPETSWSSSKWELEFLFLGKKNKLVFFFPCSCSASLVGN